MRFPIFSNQLRRVDVRVLPRRESPELIQQLFDFLLLTTLHRFYLPLHEALQKATTRFAELTGALIQAFQQIVRNGNHHLGHRVSIYGIATS
jgi:hypothetical protein